MMKRLYTKKNILFLLLSLAPGLVTADELNQANTAWVLTSTALVLFMTLPGLSLFYAGLVRSKNVLSVLMQCFAITCMISILWLAGMYSLIFTDGGAVQSFIGGLSKAFVPNMGTDSLIGDIPEAVFFMFQMTFAIITPALIVGAFAERMKFSTMMVFSALWALLVYVPVCHWVWGGGWLADMGVMDFAGGIVIHITAGVSALVAALVLGKRKGFPTVAMPPHNMPMVVTGAGMLWVGWFGFNAGSALTADGSAGMAMLVTHISAAAGSLTWMIIEWIRFGKPSVLGIVTGMVAGLGTITPASGFVGPAGALAIGITAGIVCFYAVQIIKRHYRIDDSLDVFPVHGIGGIVGSLLTGVFAAESLGGLGLGDVTILHQVGVQAVAVVATVIWSVSFSYIILKVLDSLMGLRVSDDQEVEGLDTVLHEETGYHNI
ncbi:ammonium transporter, Amt family [Bathymodiolus japonicus methanotrophic gill symbiont]|uniref:ammonium transporter n=1 Tax=Bathymodiolus japonicus methanotrophic gill symbiont TaxID=113269 RepID=UPI001B52C410|nr:ammonium transporter [Bathymodiolus japonicus methanotrophic gill symbiont]GFO71225.1 ammonium transporter, Amt family [Bathymodiolus japonicus methanotrophic gill symbiont]